MTPAGFAMWASLNEWKPAKHLNLINRKLMDLAAGRITRLILTIPPRHGKTKFASIYYPVWFLGTYPTKRVMFITHTATFAEEEVGYPTRELMRRFGSEVFGVELSEERATTSYWMLKQGGNLLAVGIDGNIMGRGADLIIIDDPIKNEQEANSTLIKDKLWKWVSSTAFSRLQPGGKVCIIHQRWAEDDLVGRLLEAERNGGEKWHLINFPAIAIENELPFPDGLGRKIGEALWPEMWPIEELLKKKNSGAFSSDVWDALYQQQPTSGTSGLFKKDWLQYYEKNNDWLILNGGERYENYNNLNIFVTVDTADKTKKTSDYSVLAVWGASRKKDLLLLDLYRDRYNYDELVKLCINIFGQFHPEYIGIENKGIAIQLINELRNRGLPIRALEPQGKGKQNRANAPLGAVVRMEAKKIFLPLRAIYLEAIKKELLSFPKGKNDDFVDVLCYACNELTKLDYAEEGDFMPYELDLSGTILKKGNNYDFATGL